METQRVQDRRHRAPMGLRNANWQWRDTADSETNRGTHCIRRRV